MSYISLYNLSEKSLNEIQIKKLIKYNIKYYYLFDHKRYASAFLEGDETL